VGTGPESHRRLSRAALAAAAVVAFSGCDLAYPEVVIVNRTADTMLLRNPSFSGCIWNVVLSNGEATSPRRCLPGRDRVHFQRLDAESYCGTRVASCALPGLPSCDGGAALDGGAADTTPVWFNYQTLSRHEISYGGFYRFEVGPDDMEQDFSIPGPYGH